MNNKHNINRFFAIVICLLSVINLTSCGSNSAKIQSLPVEQYGSAGILDGKTVIISCFADDKNTSWGKNTAKKEKIIEHLKIATDWLKAQGKLYGKDLEFVYDWKKDAYLYHETTFNEDMVDMPENGEMFAWRYIDSSLPPIDEIKKKYSAQNVVYMMLFNTPSNNRMTSCTRQYHPGLEYPYEICFMYTKYNYFDEAPSNYAHEILHTFGAPDFYTSENPDNNHNINRAFVNFVGNNFPNDIMYTTQNIQTGASQSNDITNEITKISAYYIGWEDECEYVEEFGIGKSDFERIKD